MRIQFLASTNKIRCSLYMTSYHSWANFFPNSFLVEAKFQLCYKLASVRLICTTNSGEKGVLRTVEQFVGRFHPALCRLIWQIPAGIYTLVLNVIFPLTPPPLSNYEIVICRYFYSSNNLFALIFLIFSLFLYTLHTFYWQIPLSFLLIFSHFPYFLPIVFSWHYPPPSWGRQGYFFLRISVFMHWAPTAQYLNCWPSCPLDSLSIYPGVGCNLIIFPALWIIHPPVQIHSNLALGAPPPPPPGHEDDYNGLFRLLFWEFYLLLTRHLLLSCARRGGGGGCSILYLYVSTQ